MKVIGKENNRHAMDVLTDSVTETLEKTLKVMERRLSLQVIDYETGYITLGYTYNIDTKDEWTETEFMKVNVGSESVPCLIWEVINAVFNRCVR